MKKKKPKTIFQKVSVSANLQRSNNGRNLTGSLWHTHTHTRKQNSNKVNTERPIRVPWQHAVITSDNGFFQRSFVLGQIWNSSSLVLHSGESKVTQGDRCTQTTVNEYNNVSNNTVKTTCSQYQAGPYRWDRCDEKTGAAVSLFLLSSRKRGICSPDLHPVCCARSKSHFIVFYS